MEFELTPALTAARRLLDGAVAAAPRILLALVVFGLFWMAGYLVRAVVRRGATRRRQHHTLAIALGRVSQVLIIVVGLLIAVTAAFPSFTPANFVQTLGIGSVAIGFAFKDIFQNFLSGLLILVTRPFRVGDQIVHKDFEGTVEDIQTRATFLKTYDGRRVIIPNSELYTNSVVVNTAFPQRRMEYDVGIGYGDDVATAKAIILDVLEGAEGVAPDPKADVIVVALDASTVNLRARWWSDSRIGDVLLAQDRVLSEIKSRLTAEGIDLPFPTRQILLHDQTEAGDGDRRRQREGWPAGRGDVPDARPVGGAQQVGRAGRA